VPRSASNAKKRYVFFSPVAYSIPKRPSGTTWPPDGTRIRNGVADVRTGARARISGQGINCRHAVARTPSSNDARISQIISECRNCRWAVAARNVCGSSGAVSVSRSTRLVLDKKHLRLRLRHWQHGRTQAALGLRDISGCRFDRTVSVSCANQLRALREKASGCD